MRNEGEFPTSSMSEGAGGGEEGKDDYIPNYQQGESECSYFCLRIASELTLKREFDEEENKGFDAFKAMCAKDGATLDLSRARFAKSFPDIGVFFNKMSAYSSEDEFVNPDAIKKVLDDGKIVVMGIQKMDFRGKKIIRGKDGHSICCVGYDDENFIFHDSNKCGKSCKKTMAIDFLKTGYDNLKDAGGDLSERLKLMKLETYVNDLYVVDVQEKEPELKRRTRSSFTAKEG